MTPASIPPITAADFADDMAKVFQPFPWNSDLSLLLEIAAVIGVGVLIGWLLIQIVRVPLRFFARYLDGSAFLDRNAWTKLVAIIAILVSTLSLFYLAFHADTPDQGTLAFILAFGAGAIVWFHMWRLVPSKDRGHFALLPFSPRIETLSAQQPEAATAPDAASSLDGDWADIEEQIRKENGHA